MLEFFRIYMRLKIKKEKKACFILRVQGLTLTSDGAYDKHDT